MTTCKRIFAVPLFLFSVCAETAYPVAGVAGKAGSDRPLDQAQSVPKVILKADDFAMQTSLTDWVKFIDFLNKNDLTASIGVLGKPLSKKSKEELAEMRTLLEKNKDSIELWNHGWSHWSKTTGYEFRGPDKDKQKPVFDSHRHIFV